MARSTDPAIREFTASLASGEATTVTTVQCLIRQQWYRLLGFRFERSAGSGATYTARIGDTSAWTNGDLTKERASFDATAVATDTDHQFDPPILIQSDAAGKLYVKAGWDAGDDNAATLSLYVQALGS